MNTLLSMHEAWFTITHLLDWRDALEIAACSSIIYYFSLWLKKDRQKNLLGYFYAYCLVGFSAYAAHLDTLVYLLCISSPCILFIFIMVHQHTLQKNFITLRTITPAQTDNQDWLDTLIRSCLVALNNNKAITCIIEHHDSLNEHMHADIMLKAPIKDDLLALIIESNIFDADQLLWINTQGVLLGFNAYLTHPYQEDLTLEVYTLEQWKQDALYCSAKTDAIILHITPTTRLFDVIMQGKLFEAMSASSTKLLLQKSRKSSSTNVSQGENSYVPQSKKHSGSQRST